MTHRSRLLLAGLMATLLLSAAVATASANRLSTSSQNFRAVWTPLTFAPGPVECNVTLEGSYHSATITKTVGALIGYVTRASVDNRSCTGGHATVLTETLPWHIRYRGYTGTLPNISGVVTGMVGSAFRVEINFFGASCLVRTTAEHPAVGIINVGTGGVVTGLRADEGTHIPMTNGCELFGEASFTGTARVTTPGTSTSITVRLI